MRQITQSSQGSRPNRQQRRALLAELWRRALDEPRMPDGRPSQRYTLTAWRVLKAALQHLNDESGDCYPGLRAIAKAVGVCPQTVSNVMHRLREAGWISWVPRRVYVHGQHHWGRQYLFPLSPPGLAPRARPARVRLQRVTELPTSPPRAAQLQALGLDDSPETQRRAAADLAARKEAVLAQLRAARSGPRATCV